MNERPLVSVLMTAYNREQYIVEAIKSVLASSYTNFELIVVDDCSSDNTVEIARAYEENDKRVKVYVNENNLGDYPNRNVAAGYAKGEFIMYLDSDDTILKDGIERCLNMMLKYPDENLGLYDILGEKETCKMDSSKALRTHFFKKPFLIIGPGGTIIRRKFFKEINGYPEKYGPANDMYFNLKACSQTGIILIPFEFIFYRRHEGQQINNHYSYLYNNYRYFRDALNELQLPVTKNELRWLKNKNKRRYLVNIIKYLIENRNIKKTKEAIKKAEFSFGDALSGIFHL